MEDQKKVLEGQIEALKLQEDSVRIKIAPLTKELLGLSSQRQKMQEELAQLCAARGELTFEELYERWTPQETMTEANALRREAGKMGFHGGGYWVETEKPCLSFMFYQKRRGQLDAYMEALKRIASVLKPHSDGMLWFKVFEHTLSENCSYTVHIKPDLSAAVLTSNGFGAERDEVRGPVADVLFHIWKNHWYE